MKNISLIWDSITFFRKLTVLNSSALYLQKFCRVSAQLGIEFVQHKLHNCNLLKTEVLCSGLSHRGISYIYSDMKYTKKSFVDVKLKLAVPCTVENVSFIRSNVELYLWVSLMALQRRDIMSENSARFPGAVWGIKLRKNAALGSKWCIVFYGTRCWVRFQPTDNNLNEGVRLVLRK